MNEGGRDSHFNVNVRTGIGSRATMANNEDSFLRAMEIQERKRAKKELENPKEEEIVDTAPVEIAEPALSEVIQEEAAMPVAEEPPAVEPTPAKPATVAKPSGGGVPGPTQKFSMPLVFATSGGGVPGPTPRSDFTAEERAAMLKRARAHAAEVKAGKK